MTYEFIINAVVDTTDASAPLGIEMWVDDVLIHNIAHVQQATSLSAAVADEDGKEHELKFVLKNKLPEHTKIDEAGNIVKDVLITINDLEFDGIKLGHVFNTHATYSHNYNNTAADIVEPFNGVAGCNGTISLKFTTPAYLWLLENM